MQNKRYKCVKKFPGSCEVGTIAEYEVGYGYRVPSVGWYGKNIVEDYPEFWQQVEEVKLEVPIGTRFQHHLTKDLVYTIHSVENETVKVVWAGDNTRYSISQVNSLFKSGTWTIYKEKEFEILEYISKQGLKIDTGDEIFDVISKFGNKDWNIYQVKRLSDGIVFNVGDKVYWEWISCGNHKYLTISEFYLLNEELRFKVKEIGDKDFNFNLTYHTLKYYKQPLFLDELGNEVFKGDTFYFVNPMFWDLERGKAQYGDLRTEMHHFKNKVDAEKYIIDNKPTFSRKQIKQTLWESNLENYLEMNNVLYFKEKLGL